MDVLDWAIAQEKIHDTLVEAEKNDDVINKILEADLVEESDNQIISQLINAEADEIQYKQNEILREQNEKEYAKKMSDIVLKSGYLASTLDLKCIGHIMDYLAPHYRPPVLGVNKHWNAIPDQLILRQAAKGLRWCTINEALPSYKLVADYSLDEEIITSLIVSIVRDKRTIFEWIVENMRSIKNTLGWMLFIAIVYDRKDMANQLIPKVDTNISYYLQDCLLHNLIAPSGGTFIDEFRGYLRIEDLLRVDVTKLKKSEYQHDALTNAHYISALQNFYASL